MAMPALNIAQIRTSTVGPERPLQGVKPEPVAPIARPLPIRKSLSPGVRMALPATFRRGGRVKRTGWAKVHKGETVVPAAAASMGAGKSKSTKTPRAKRKIQKTMDEWKSGSLHSGSKQGPVVKSQKQAIAIALSQARKKA